jgi:hypothetical protein
LFIQTEQTPNPSTLKFLPGRVVMETGTKDFSGPDTATTSPLAKRLFAIEGVERVFFGSDFVTVTKADAKDWQVMKPSILGGIMEHYTSGEPVLAADRPAGEAAEAAVELPELDGDAEDGNRESTQALRAGSRRSSGRSVSQ